MGAKITWATAAPLWRAFDGEKTQTRRPALLRFASDSFMEDLIRTLEEAPQELVDLVARPESDSERPIGAREGWAPEPGALKLYQPAHGRFYLVAASLVCEVPGLPDRSVRPEEGESVGFVMRRLDGASEQAWIDLGGESKRWLVHDDRETVHRFEEILPLFPVAFDDQGFARRVLVGLVPVVSREVWRDASSRSDGEARQLELEQRVIRPFAAVEEPSGELADYRKAVAFAFLDLADFLSTHLHPVWSSITATSVLPRGAMGTLAGELQPLVPALRAVWGRREELQDGTLDDAALEKIQRDLDAVKRVPKKLKQLILDALKESKSPPVVNEPLKVPKHDPRSPATYVVRCVYRRPGCGESSQVLSDPTEAFQLATYFDPDAPQRPVRIAMPFDTSVAGLRKFKKSVGFVLSKKLRKQMSRAVDLKSLMEGKLAPEGPVDMDMVCSFSIPIVTICALILLLIIVNLLNMVFWWLPFFRVCLPIKPK
jgi:hypothetical protein